MPGTTIDPTPAPGLPPDRGLSALRPDLRPEGPAPQPSASPGQEGQEASAAQSSQRDQVSQQLQLLMEQRLYKDLHAFVQRAQEELTDLLLNWEPDPKKTPEENYQELSRVIQEFSRQAASQGGTLQLTSSIEQALLEALARLLLLLLAQLLELLGPDGPQGGLEDLLDVLFRQLTGHVPARGHVSHQAASLLRGESARASSHGAAPSAGTGVLYRRGNSGGVRLESPNSGQPRQLRQAARTIDPAILQRGSSPKTGGPAVTMSQVAGLERFAHTVLAQPYLPPSAQLPAVSEERLGLELSLLWLEGEAAASRPGLPPQVAHLLRQTAEQRSSAVLQDMAHTFHASARSYPPSQCPDLLLADIVSVRSYLASRYHATRDPERSMLETVAYTLELFRRKQGEERYRVWLRYAAGRGLFGAEAGRQDLRAGWEYLCRRWEIFLQSMELAHAPAFRSAQGLRSLWAMVLPPREHTGGGRGLSPWTLAGWLACAGGLAGGFWALLGSGAPPLRTAAAAGAVLLLAAAWACFRRSGDR